MAQKRSKWTLVLDGKAYREGVFEDGLDLASYICRAPRGDPLTVYGFTSPHSFEVWARSQGVLPEIQQALSGVAKATRQTERLDEAERKRIERSQDRFVAEANRMVRRILAQNGVNPGDVPALRELSKKGLIGSLFLYDRTRFRRPFLYLPTRLPGILNSYPRLSRFGWNDRAESVINGTSPIILKQHAWFKGKGLYLLPGQSDPDLGDFNNRASSVLFV